jgi:tRNA threonylcarbamoyl adenosine modification protein (Sua5/YciO/YrdC/YwlC family)
MLPRVRSLTQSLDFLISTHRFYFSRNPFVLPSSPSFASKFARVRLLSSSPPTQSTMSTSGILEPPPRVEHVDTALLSVPFEYSNSNSSSSSSSSSLPTCAELETQLSSHPAILEAARLLRDGQTVGFPTETVYGLGANALNDDAVAGIYRAKGRPSDNPLIVHIADFSDMHRLAADGCITEEVTRLAAAFWPGPLSIIISARPGLISARVRAGLPSVAVRLPSHPVARALIRAAGVPLAAPSANLSGRPSPTTAAHVWQDLQGRVPAIVDGGPAGTTINLIC